MKTKDKLSSCPFCSTVAKPEEKRLNDRPIFLSVHICPKHHHQLPYLVPTDKFLFISGIIGTSKGKKNAVFSLEVVSDNTARIHHRFVLPKGEKQRSVFTFDDNPLIIAPSSKVQLMVSPSRKKWTSGHWIGFLLSRSLYGK